jgi:hypothetical protein
MKSIDRKQFMISIYEESILSSQEMTKVTSRLPWTASFAPHLSELEGDHVEMLHQAIAYRTMRISLVRMTLIQTPPQVSHIDCDRSVRLILRILRARHPAKIQAEVDNTVPRTASVAW